MAHAHSLLAVLRDSPGIVYRAATEDFAEAIPWALAAMGIGVGGLVLAWIFIKMGECCTGARSTTRWKQSHAFRDEQSYKKVTHQSRESIARVVTMSLAILSVLFGFWIAASTAGFNFWTVMLGYGILSMVITYAFGMDTLRSAGAFLIIALTDKIETNWWIEVGGVEGRVTAIHLMWCELVYYDKKVNFWVEIHIPTYYVISMVLKRNFFKEVNEKAPPADDEVKVRKLHKRLAHQV